MEDETPFEREESEIPNYIVELAKSGRAECKRCDEKIGMKELRVGVVIDCPMGIFTRWTHLKCTVFHKSVESAILLDGYFELDSDTQEMLQKRVESSKFEKDPDAVAIDPDELVRKDWCGTMDAPRDLLMPLLPFQKEGLGWMVHQEGTDIRGGILADEMGMGKTIQAVSLILANRPRLDDKDVMIEWNKSDLRHDIPPNTLRKAGTLVVLPMVAIRQWQTEIFRFTREGSLSVVVYHGDKRSDDLNALYSADIVLTSYKILESEHRKATAGTKILCRICGRKFYPEKLRVHRKYFCGESSRRTEAQAKTEKKKSNQLARQKAGNASDDSEEDEIDRQKRMIKEMKEKGSAVKSKGTTSKGSAVKSNGTPSKGSAVKAKGTVSQKKSPKDKAVSSESESEDEIDRQKKMLKEMKGKGSLIKAKVTAANKKKSSKDKPASSESEEEEDEITMQKSLAKTKVKTELKAKIESETAAAAYIKSTKKTSPAREAKSPAARTPTAKTTPSAKQPENDQFQVQLKEPVAVAASSERMRPVRACTTPSSGTTSIATSSSLSSSQGPTSNSIGVLSQRKSSRATTTPSSTSRSVTVSNTSRSKKRVQNSDSDSDSDFASEDDGDDNDDDDDDSEGAGTDYVSSDSEAQETPKKRAKGSPATRVPQSKRSSSKSPRGKTAKSKVSQTKVEDSEEEEDEDDDEDEEDDFESNSGNKRKRTGSGQKNKKKNVSSGKGKSRSSKRQTASDDGEDEDVSIEVDSGADSEVERDIAKAMREARKRPTFTSTLHGASWFRVILDEAHMVKDRASSTARAVFNLVSLNKWCLTGTPLQNRVGELYSLIRFLRIDPHAYYFCRSKNCSCKSLHYRFSKVVIAVVAAAAAAAAAAAVITYLSYPVMSSGKCEDCGHIAMQHFCHFNKHILNPIQRSGFVAEGRKAMMKLKEQVLDEVLLRRTKTTRAEDIQLPPRLVRVRQELLNPQEEDFYQALYTQSQAQFDTYVTSGTVLNNYAHIFDILIRLRQAVDHPYLVIHSDSLSTRTASAGANAGSNDNDNGNGDVVNRSASKDDISEPDCCMCHDPADSDGQAVRAACGHVFCSPCLSDLLDASTQITLCPECSEPLTVSTVKSSASATSSSRKGKSFLNKIDLSKFQSSTKLEILMQELHGMLQRDPGAKAIVFSQFVNMLDLVGHRLCLGGMKSVKLLGSLSMDQREKAISTFREQSDTPVLLISLKAGGVALNLTVANYIFLMDPWWNPAAEMQAIDRTHRIGQRKPIYATRIIVRNSIEERLLLLQEKKKLVFDGTVGGDASSMARLTVDDMRFLFQLTKYRRHVLASISLTDNATVVYLQPDQNPLSLYLTYIVRIRYQ
eukprot:gene5925-11955_t